jgi:methyl-accepting chemotaxis protein
MPEFRWLYLAFTNDLFINYPGSILDRSMHPYSASSQPWYIDILSGSPDITYVEPYFDEFERVLLISIGRVVRYDNGTIIGVISGDISVADINEKVLDVQVLESGYASLIEKSGGGIIAHPELSPEDYADFWVENEILMPLTEVERNNDTTEALSDTQLLQIRSVQSGGVGNLTYTRNGENHLLVYASVERGNYIVVIVVPEDEVLSAIPPLEERIDTANQQALAFILAVTVGGIIVAGAVAIVIANQITRPLQYLMDLATRNVEAMIKEESLDSIDLRVDTTYISQDDEIGELARAFQGMLDSIKEDES